MLFVEMQDICARTLTFAHYYTAKNHLINYIRPMGEAKRHQRKNTTNRLIEAVGSRYQPWYLVEPKITKLIY